MAIWWDVIANSRSLKVVHTKVGEYHSFITKILVLIMQVQIKIYVFIVTQS